MDDKLVSIIILSYNNLEYYRTCMESVLMQDYSNIEIVLSDDGTQNFELHKIAEYLDANKKPNISNVVINCNSRNLGIVRNYNKAIKLSSGEYIFYLGIDDALYDKGTITDTVNFFEATDFLIFTGYRDIYDQTMNNYIKTLPRDLEVSFLKKNDSRFLFEKLCISNFIAGSCTPFSRKLIDEYGYLDENYTILEDYPRYLSITKMGCNIGFIDRKLIKYRLGGVTTSGQANEKYQKDYSLVKKATEEFFLDNWKLGMLEGRRLIAWGTGACYQECKEWLEFEIEYFIDSNKDLQGKLLEGKKIHSPEILQNESKNDVFILVFSYANYYEIGEWLMCQGFEEKINYYCCAPEILKLII